MEKIDVAIQISEEDGEGNSYNNYINVPDKKYFHKTRYAKMFYDVFDVELKPNTEQFELIYSTFRTLIKIYKGLITYKQNKKEQYNYIKDILENYLTDKKSKINKCWDKLCIELYYEFEKWYDELLEMEKINKYNFKKILSMAEYILDKYSIKTFMMVNKTKTNKNYNEDKKYIIKRNYKQNYDLDKFEWHSEFLKDFKRKYNQILTLREYSYVIDTLTIIIYTQNHINHKEYLNKGLSAYFNDYPQKVNINDDFNTNYEILNFIYQNNDINSIGLMLKSLLQKNIYFLEQE